jgi:uncharacterized membrane protein
MNKQIIIITLLISILFGLVILGMVLQSNDVAKLLDGSEYVTTPPLHLEGYTPPPGPPPSDATLVDTESNIDRQLQSLFAAVIANTSIGATTVEQCRLLPLGHMPCGGPANYHVYSTEGSNEAVLLELSVQHQSLSQQVNQATEIAGVCMITPEPVLSVVDGNCIAVNQLGQ